MIDIALVEDPVDMDKFKLRSIEKASLFLGFIIKNKYDENRLSINEIYSPEKFSIGYKENDNIKLLPLYGIFVSLNQLSNKLSNLIIRQERYESVMNLNMFTNILEEYNLSCNDSYCHFYKGIYPIDNKHFDKLTDDKIGNDKRIFQHMLGLNENKFDFQKFGSLKLLLLT